MGQVTQAARRSFPASLAQEQMWFLDQLDPHTATYNIPAAFRLKGALDLAALERSVQAVVGRHDTLRTTFETTLGTPIQVVHDASCVAVSVQTISATDPVAQATAIERLAIEEARKPFNLETGPLLRVTILRLGSTDHVLLLTLHHIVGDGWSLELLLRDIATLYTADLSEQTPELPALPAQYGDFAVWQRDWLHGDALEQQLAYWREQLAGPLPVLTLPTDHSRPATSRHRGAQHACAVPRGLLEKITALSRQERVTHFIVLLAAFQTLLSRYSEQEDIAVGVPFANHANRPETKVESLIGLFANTLVLRGNLSGNPTFREILRRNRVVAFGAHAHNELPFGKLVEDLQPERSLGYMPLFQVMLSHVNAWTQALRLPGVDVSEIPVGSGTSKCDLAMLTTESPDNISITLEYDVDLFDEPTIERMGQHFVRLLEGAAENPDRKLSELPLLSQAERHQVLVEWNETAVAIPERCIHEQFEQQAMRTPEAVAVEHDDEILTYRELDRRANRLAHKLRTLGVGPDVLVGLCLERSLDFVVAVLGTLKAGGAYVPLDPGLPPARLATLIESAGLTIVLTQQQHAGALELHRASVICLDASREALEPEPDYAPALSMTPANLAYVMFTSGSTGRPKAVAVPHRAVIRLLFGVDYVNLGSGTITLLLAPTSFDASTFELWAPLLHGGRCVLFSGRELTLAELGQTLKAHHVNCLWLTASLFNLVIDEAPDILRDVKQLLTGGEAISVAHVRRALDELPDTVLINGYGPTESTTFACCHRIPRQVSTAIATVPIGRPISNTTVYVLDQQRQPVPVGVPGELYIGGDGLARSYLNDPTLTRERFVPDPFKGEPGARLYRSGDRGRYLADGTIEFLGRLDTQVKIRGFRVEPGEVEAALREHPQVREALVVLREDRPGDPRLVAYVVPRADPGPPLDDLRGFLQARLPAYMVPAAFVSLPSLPLTRNGKVDRRALPAPGVDRSERGPRYVPPHTPVEELLAAIWGTVLGVERVGVHDNFFDLGGHSLLATQVVARVRHAYHVELPVRSVFEAPTVAGLAQQIAALQPLGPRASTVPLRPVPHHAALPLSYAQERLWFLDRLEPASALYNVPFALRLRGPLDVAALARSLREILRRHEVLRTTLPAPDGRPLQILIDEGTFSLAVVDLRERSPAERVAEANRLAEDEARRPFDLAQDLLLRASLLQMGATDHVLLLTLHHIATDGWSLRILDRELAALYAAFAAGQASPLAELPLQYADFGVWQRTWLEADVLQPQLAYWQRQLHGAPAGLAVPSDRPRPPVQRHRGAHQTATVDPALARALRGLNRQEGVTLFMTLLAAFQVLLFRYSGQDDLVVGTPIAARTHRELEGLIGFFVNTLPLRCDLSGNPTFRELLGRVRDVTLDAYAHPDVPFEKLVEHLQPERTLRQSPVFQVLFTLQPAFAFALRDVAVTLTETATGTAKFDLTLAMIDEADGLRALLEYDTDLFDPQTMARLLAHFQVVLAGIVADPECRLADLPLPTAAAHPPAVEWNQTAVAIPKRTHEPFGQPAPARTVNGKAEAPRDEIERRLVVIWKSVFGIRDVGIRDDFFELGGHSLLAARMFGRIEKEFGTAPPLATLFQEATIDHLAETLRGQRLEPAWGCLVPIQPLGTRPPVFFMHGVGGNVLNYRDLARHLGSDQPVYGLQSHGLNGQVEPDVTIKAMAARYVGEIRRLQPEGPYRLGGLSLGGVVAFEVAQQLSRQGQQVSLLALFDSWRPGFTTSLSTRELYLHKLSEYSRRARFHLAEFLKPDRATRVLRKSRTVKRRVRTRLWQIGYFAFRRLGRRLPAALYRVNDANAHAVSEYAPQVYPGRISLFSAATRSVGAFDDPALGWNGWAAAGVEIFLMPGDHLTLLAEPNVAVLAEKLAMCLDRSAPDETSAPSVTSQP